jgi:hypothetical protein
MIDTRWDIWTIGEDCEVIARKSPGGGFYYVIWSDGLEDRYLADVFEMVAKRVA